MKKIFIVIALLFLPIAIYSIAGLRSSDSELKSEINNPESRIRRYVAAEGKVEAMPGKEVEVGSDLLSAKIEKVFAQEGDRVAAGDVLVKLDDRDTAARLKAAEAELSVAKARYRETASGSRKEEIQKADAALEAAYADRKLAKANLERYERLYQESMIPKALLEDKENLFQVAEARVREAAEQKRLLEKGPKEETLKLYEETVAQAEANVAYYRKLMEKNIIKSPITGKVLRKYLDAGEAVTPETPIIAVADVENIRINAEVDETDVGRIKTGDPATITSDAYPGKVFQGEIQEIADYVGARKVKPNNPVKNLDMKVVQVKIALKEKTPLKLGMTVDVKITSKE